MKAIQSLIAALCIACSILTPAAFLVSAGCKSTPHQVAYKTADAVVSSVDVAMRGWADYVVAERRRIAKLPTAEQLGPKSELLKREGRVAKAYGEYQQAVELARDAVRIALEHNNLGHGDAAPRAVADAASRVVSTITANR